MPLRRIPYVVGVLAIVVGCALDKPIAGFAACVVCSVAMIAIAYLESQP